MESWAACLRQHSVKPTGFGKYIILLSSSSCSFLMPWKAILTVLFHSVKLGYKTFLAKLIYEPRTVTPPIHDPSPCNHWITICAYKPIHKPTPKRWGEVSPFARPSLPLVSLPSTPFAFSFPALLMTYWKGLGARLVPMTMLYMYNM